MKILAIGDGIRLQTGFSNLIRPVLLELVRRGHSVSQLAGMDYQPIADPAYYVKHGVHPYLTNTHDTLGYSQAQEVIEHSKPDVIFMCCDAGSAYGWLFEVTNQETLSNIPIVGYLPVEGAPIMPEYAKVFERLTLAYTYTHWSAKQLAKEHQLFNVQALYPGVDLMDYHPIDSWQRKLVRQELGWGDKFVVTYVAKNVQRKSQDRLVKAMAELRASGIEDVILYLHCKANDAHMMGGWDLEGLAHWCGVKDVVQFSPQQRSWDGESLHSLTNKLAASDLYFHAAGVEGFGIPIIEAMACGLPVITVQDNGNIDEIANDGRYGSIRPIDWATWFNGAQVGMLSPVHIAETIAAAKEQLANQKLKQMVSERAIKHARSFTKADYVDRMCSAIESASLKIETVAV